MTYFLDSYRTYLFTQIFAFEVIPKLADSNCGTRREIELSPRILKWELNQRPMGDKLDEVFTDDVSIFIVNVQYVYNYNGLTTISDVCEGSIGADES